MDGRERKYRAQLFLLGCLVGAVTFLLIFGISPLDFGNDSFCRGGFIEKDIQQHYAGWLFYRRASIGWPLCVTPDLNYPQGLSVAYTDSIPLAAAFFRQIAPEWGIPFQYFGFFTFLSYCLQGGFAALLCGLFAEGLRTPVLGSVLFSLSPVLLERAFRHTSLGAQFLILGALYYYFKGRREGKCCYAGLFLLNLLAIGIHPYFLPMTYAVTLALVVETAWQRRQWIKPFAFLGANLAGSLVLGWSLGLFYGSATSGGQALYGYFSMNLNSLWNPVGVNGIQYSLLLPAQNTVNGNYDAFAYLGLGVLLALPFALFVGWRHRFSLLKTHWFLSVVSIILTIFAVSHVITANGAVLFTLSLPDSLIKLCSVFRSGGRLFWPVYYLLMLAAFTGAARLARKPILCVTVLVLLQTVDLSPALLQRHNAMQQTDAFPTALQSDFWAAAETQYRNLVSMQGFQDDALHLALYAADHGMTTNDPFAARYDANALEAQRSALKGELQNGVLREDVLYLFENEGDFLQAVDLVKEDAWCGEVRDRSGEHQWYAIAPGLQGKTFDSLCTPYDDDYPLRLAEYTDALWNRGVLDQSKKTVCFADSPFTRQKLQNAKALCADGIKYTILQFDDSDPGWLMITLEIEDATVLWDKELTTE